MSDQFRCEVMQLGLTWNLFFNLTVNLSDTLKLHLWTGSRFMVVGIIKLA